MSASGSSDTIGALQSKLSVESLVEQVAHAVAEHGGEIGRNLGRRSGTTRCRRS